MNWMALLFLAVLVGMGVLAGLGVAKAAAVWPHWRHIHKKGETIPFRFLAVGAALVILFSALPFINSWLFPALVVLGLVLLFAALVDARTRLLPDMTTLGLIPIGLWVQYGLVGWHGVGMGVLGAAIGYGALWLISFLYRRWRKQDGLGLGDAKLLAAGGAWCGPLALSWIVLIGAGLALLFLLWPRADRKPLSASTSLPFGPALGIGIYVAFLFAIKAHAMHGPPPGM